MHWSKAHCSGATPVGGFRSQSATMVGKKMFIYGGYDSSETVESFPHKDGNRNNHLLIFDCDTMHYTRPLTTGNIPGAKRAHSSTLIDNKLYVFGGGDGATYFSDLHVLDINIFHWTKPEVTGKPPGPRRAHSVVQHGKKIFIFGGGDGNKALNEVYVLDTEKMSWDILKASGTPPQARGYHSAVIYGDKMYVYGGSDGTECFSDVFALDLQTGAWTRRKTGTARPSFSHTATMIGPWMLVFGGHNASDNVNELRFLNMDPRVDVAEWVTRYSTGVPPSPRGYHSSVLYDSRVFCFGGYDGKEPFHDMHILDLGVFSLLNSATYLNTNSFQ